ncbi:MAG: hypothetical protein U0Q15_02120 [Kineosporiaceae bacterium]
MVGGRHGPVVATAGADGTVRLWAEDGTPRGRPLCGHQDQVATIAAVTSAAGHVLLLSGGHDGTLRLWDPEDGSLRHTVPLGDAVHALAQQAPDPGSRRRTGGGATVTVGVAGGVVSVDLHAALFDGGVPQGRGAEVAVVRTSTAMGRTVRLPHTAGAVRTPS